MSDRRPHLLYTAWGFPPSRAGGVYRALATVNAFAEAGWDVTVLTVPRGLFESSTGIDPTLEEKIAPGVEVVRIEPDIPSFQNDLSRWSRTRARHPELWRVADRWRDLVGFPEAGYGRWRPALECAAEAVHAAKPVDLAVGTANPNVDFATGWYLHERHGVPYVMDYRDAWTLDVFSGADLRSWVPGVDRKQRALLAGAAEVWFVNEPIRAWHAERFPAVADRMHVVANGYESYGEPLAVPVRTGREQGLVFGYIGTITDQVHIDVLLAAWEQARGAAPLAGAQLELFGYLGHFSESSARLSTAIEAARDHGVAYRGPVGKSEIGRTYRELDALVLALGTGRYVTSGKVFEYAATGLPIVSVHDPGNAATQVLETSPAWVGARSLAVDDVARALVETAELAAAQTPEERAAAQAWASQFERRRQLDPRIAALGALVR